MSARVSNLRFRYCLALILCIAMVEYTWAATFPDNVDPDAAIPETPQILSPTLGRPALIGSGQTVSILARIPNPVAPLTIELVSPRDSRRRFSLNLPENALNELHEKEMIVATVPADVPQQTYDLSISCGGARLTSSHCVAVGDFSNHIRIVHLSNMNIGDVGAPTFNRQLVEEINLIAPSLIVGVGDYLDVTHPDPEKGWRDLVAFFREFDAPLILACGDHDNVDEYSRYIAPSPVGLISFGPYRALVLYDLPRVPIIDDADQLEWIERNWPMTSPKGLTMIVTHDDTPNLLYRWQRQGTLADRLIAGRLGLWFAGGHRDWNGVDYRPLIDAAYPMLYVRTHQSSSAPRGGASGECHYRVIDVENQQATFPQGRNDVTAAPASMRIGLLHVGTDGPNDGSRDALTVTASNNHPFRIDNAAFTVKLRKVIGLQPWCHGGRLLSTADGGGYWECRVGFDLPDKGAVCVMCGSGPEPQTEDLSVAFQTPDNLPFHAEATALGLPYFRLQAETPVISVMNNGTRRTDLSPLVRLDGELLAYRPRDGGTDFATAYRLFLNPGESVELEIDMSAVRVTPGRRDLQVYLDTARPGASFSHTLYVTEAK